MSRILVIRGGAIGDFILTLPALRLLREGFPAAHLEVLGYTHIVALAQVAGYADAIRSVESGKLASFFSRNGNLAPELVEYFGAFQQVVSYLFDPDAIFTANLQRAGVRNLITGSPKITDQEHAARQLARPLERLALYLDDPAPILKLPGKAEVDRDQLAVHPGSGSESKNWPIERFVAIAESWLALNEKRNLLIVGGEADEARLVHLRRALPAARVATAINLPLPQLSERLRDCGIFLGHDSGISHLAAAVGRPALLLFGLTDPAIWAPANPAVRVLRSPSLTVAGIQTAAVLAALAEMTATS